MNGDNLLFHTWFLWGNVSWTPVTCQHPMCPNCDNLVCCWKCSTSWGCLPSAVERRKKVRESQAGIWSEKMFHGFFPLWLWRNVPLQLLWEIQLEISNSGSYPGQVRVLRKLKYLYLLLYLAWNLQQLEILSPPFPTASLRKAPQLSLQNILRSSCDWPNFINDGFKAWWDWGCLC